MLQVKPFAQWQRHCSNRPEPKHASELPCCFDPPSGQDCYFCDFCAANIPKAAKCQDLIWIFWIYNIIQYQSAIWANVAMSDNCMHWLHSNLSNTLASWSAYRFKRASRTLCWSSSKRWCSAFKPNKKLVVIRTVGSLDKFRGFWRDQTSTCFKAGGAPNPHPLSRGRTPKFKCKLHVLNVEGVKTVILHFLG